MAILCDVDVLLFHRIRQSVRLITYKSIKLSSFVIHPSSISITTYACRHNPALPCLGLLLSYLSPVLRILKYWISKRDKVVLQLPHTWRISSSKPCTIPTRLQRLLRGFLSRSTSMYSMALGLFQVICRATNLSIVVYHNIIHLRIHITRSRKIKSWLMLHYHVQRYIQYIARRSCSSMLYIHAYISSIYLKTSAITKELKYEYFL
jgi:hypothetical protein